MIEMIAGAARELSLGDPRDIATHVGPVIEADAQEKLDRWIEQYQSLAASRFRWDDGQALPAQGFFVPPTIIELDRASDLKEEVFGPVLHVVRWRADELDRLLDEIAGNGTALTLGIHSRIDARVARIAARMSNGNVYVNRSMIGAVVGTQPFGGAGTVRHRAESGRAELSAALRDRADRYGEHRGCRRQCEPLYRRRIAAGCRTANCMRCGIITKT